MQEIRLGASSDFRDMPRVNVTGGVVELISITVLIHLQEIPAYSMNVFMSSKFRGLHGTRELQ